MRSFCLLLIITSLILSPCSVWAQSQDEISVAQLKAEIQKLVAVEQDQATPPEVRELNRTFLKKRRIQLQALLQKNFEGLRSYLATMGASLRADERLIVENKILEAERELQSFAAETAAGGNRESATSVSGLETSARGTTISNSSSPSSEIGGGNGNVNGNGPPTPVVSAPPVTNPTTTSANVPQTQPSTSFNATLNARIRAKARVDQTDNTKQTETPSLSSNTTSLVDQSSASDLIGIAANFAGLSATSNDNGEEPSSVSVTTSAYSLLAAIKRVDPLNPVFYDQHRKWRNFSVTLGYDDEDQPDGTKQRAKLFGAKFMFLNRRDPSLTRNRTYIDAISFQLQTAATAFGTLTSRAQGHVFGMEAVRRQFITPGFTAFLEKRKTEEQLKLEQNRNTMSAADIAQQQAKIDRIKQLALNPGSDKLFVLGSNGLPVPGWSEEELEYRTIFLNEFLGPNYRDKLGQDIADAVDKFIDDQLTDAELLAFRNLDDSAREALESIRRAPQMSVAFTTKQRRIGIDEYLGTLTFDYGVADRINLTLNGAYTYNDSKVIGGDVRGFRFSGGLKFQLNRENLLGKKPFFFDIATQGSWMNNTDALYKAQGKLTIPIADGIDFPISVTYANRTALIDEKEVRGQFGFTLDTARLIRAFLFR